MSTLNKKLTLAQIILLIVISLLCIMVMVPFFLMIIKSFKDFDQEILKPITITFPLCLENYVIAWEYVKSSIFNSIFVSLAIGVATVVLSAMGAFAFARYDFPCKGFIFSLCIALMMVPSILILTTKYFLVSVTFNLQNNYLGVILPQASGLLPFGFLLTKGAIDAVPKDLFDAADIDGANSVKQFIAILVPLSMPILATLFLMNFMTSWNDYLWPMMILRKDTMFTIPVNLQTFSDSFYKMNNYYAPPLAGYVIVSIPLLLLFSFTSKQFISGMTSGAFKM